MEIALFRTKEEMGRSAAERAASGLRQAIAENGKANLILATGASQFQMLSALLGQPNIDWTKVTAFHLDEYIGIPDSHAASFRKYLRERFVSQLPTPLAAFHYIAGDADDPPTECRRVGEIIKEHPIDVACIGIGENGHLAFNDPPADFQTEAPYVVVRLDEKCRRQQVGEGWFGTLDNVPAEAVSMSVKQILKSKRIVVCCPDRRKAEAVRKTVEGDITNKCPASILRTHPDCTLFLDTDSASELSTQFQEQ